MVELWPSVRSEIRLMRAFLACISADLGRKLFPALLAQDAAGPGEGSPTGGFCCGLGFPDATTMELLLDRHEAVGLSLRK